MGFKFNFKHEGLNAMVVKDTQERIEQDKQIRTTMESEGQDLPEKIVTAVYKYKQNQGLSNDDALEFTMTDCISWLKGHVDDFRTSIPVEGRDWNNTMSNWELNVYNIVPALRARYTAKRVSVLWAWKDAFSGEEETKISDIVTATEILAHDDAKLKIIIKGRTKVSLFNSKQYLVGEDFGHVKGEAPENFSCEEDLFEGMTF